MDNIQRRLIVVFVTIAILQYYQQQYNIAMYKQQTAVTVYQPALSFYRKLNITQPICIMSDKPVVEFNCKWQYTCVPTLPVLKMPTNQKYRRP